jgi:hypothetical protein
VYVQNIGILLKFGEVLLGVMVTNDKYSAPGCVNQWNEFNSILVEYTKVNFCNTSANT